MAFSFDDLRALVEYIASDPAIPFPELTPEEIDALKLRVMDEWDEAEQAASQEGEIEKSQPRLIVPIKCNR